jgi:ribokinase
VAEQGGVLVAGSINTDLVVHLRRSPEAGETVTGSSFAIFGGGKGANQTVASARSGASTAILGAVGNDDFGKQRLASLRAELVDVESVAVNDVVASGVALIFVEGSGENRIAYVPGATNEVSASEAEEAFNRVQPKVVLATLELPGNALTALFAKAKNGNSTVIVNATPEPSQGKELAAQADVLIVNETEACELLGISIGGQDWGSIAGDLLALGPDVVVITLGSQGAVFKSSQSTLAIPAPVVKVVDSTGAGDAFCGAFAAAVARGESFDKAAKVGATAGSLSVTKRGAQPSMPSIDEIHSLLRAK